MGRWIANSAACMVWGVGALAHCDAAEPATLYVSKLPLNEAPAAPDPKREGEDLHVYCTADQSPASESRILSPQMPLCEEARVIRTSEDKLRVVYVATVAGTAKCNPGEPPKDFSVDVVVEEIARKSALAIQVAAVGKFIQREPAGAAAPDVAAPEFQFCYVEKYYVLKTARANAKVTTKVTSSGKTLTSIAALKTGPAEHWFLSGDVAVRGPREIKYDPDKKIILQRDKPQQAYLGINYMLGDVYQKYPRWDTERIVFKLMLTPNKRPFDAVGVGIGYRFAEGFSLKNDAQPSGGFMVFAGSFWTRNEQTDAAGTTVQRGGRTHSVRLGLSYSLDTLFGWLN